MIKYQGQRSIILLESLPKRHSWKVEKTLVGFGDLARKNCHNFENMLQKVQFLTLSNRTFLIANFSLNFDYSELP